jgi:two-component sensor histidine kinase
VPKLLALPSPTQLATLNAELEQRVADRTAELRSINERLTAAADQRDLLLREVYHRVKNNLQTVDSLLLMQARRLADPKAKQALLDLRGRVYALGLVHQQLMGSDNLRTFDIAPFLRELSSNILLSGDNTGVILAVDACPLYVGLDFAIPLGLLVTELITNSLKHAFPDHKGNISLALSLEPDDTVVLVIGDDGRGLPEAGAAAGSGLGAGIVRGLVAQLEGSLTVTNHGGVRTEIRAPLREAA